MSDESPHTEAMSPGGWRFKKNLEAHRRMADDIPTEPGSVFRISDFGFEDGGSAIVAIKRAFEDCWGQLALRVPGEYDSVRTYSFKGASPIYIDAMSDEAWDPEQHGPQVIGQRLSYQFMADIEEDDA